MDSTDQDLAQQRNDASSAATVASFMHGGGEMGAAIRAHDWSASLGPPARWPQSLRTVVRLMLSTEHPVFIFWGADNICLYNDSYMRFLGAELHPRLFGARGADVWDDVWPVVYPQIEFVLAGRGSTWHEDQCIPLPRDGVAEERFWTYSYSPIDDDAAPNHIGGVLVICAETTQKIIVQRHQAFRLQLEAALRRQATPASIVATSIALLGEFLKASYCGYGDIDAAKQRLQVTGEWTDGVHARPGPFIHLSEFGPSFLAWHRHGRAIWVEDPTLSSASRNLRGPLFNSLRAQSGLAAPLVQNGRLAAALFIYQGKRMHWTEQHQALVRDVAERTFEAVELARAATQRDQAAAALRDSEARYRSLVEASAALVCEMPASGEFATPQPQWSEYTGQSFDELKGWGWLNAVHPDDQDRVTETLGRAFEAKSNFELRYRLRSRDGHFHPMLVRAVAITHADKTLSGWIGMHTDSPG